MVCAQKFAMGVVARGCGKEGQRVSDRQPSWRGWRGWGGWVDGFFERERRRLNRWLVDTLARRIGLPVGSRVLECGSGTGFGSSLFAARTGVCLSVAMDLDVAALQHARQRNPMLPAVAANAYQLPFPSSVFDLVWNNSTVEHLVQPERVLEEMSRVTKPAGHVFVGVPYRFGPLGCQPWISRTELGEWIGPVFDPSHLTRLVAEQGLIPEARFTYFHRCFVGVLARKSDTITALP